MRSSEASRLRLGTLASCLLIALTTPLRAQEAVQGFAVERLYLSAPGAGYFVMDALSQHGALSGALALTTGYAQRPLQLRAAAGADSLSVVSERSFVNLGLAATYERLRLYVNFDMPLTAHGQSGVIDGHAYTAPDVGLVSHPDLVGEARLGADVRLYGEPGGPLRTGLGAQLFFPNGERATYTSDDRFRACLRALLAGDLARFTYAAQLGLHVRPLHAGHAPGAPEGSELLFGVAAGARARLGSETSVVIGPELFGASAFAHLLSTHATSLECLASARLETRVDHARSLRVKLGLGGGLSARFGAPAWRAVLALELFGDPD